MIFVETPPFERLREEYFGDEHYRLLQVWLMANPKVGDVIRVSDDYGSWSSRLRRIDMAKRNLFEVIREGLEAIRVCNWERYAGK